MVVFSPSNMKTYLDCPRRFQAQSITKEIKWQASKQKSRGTLVHNALEKALTAGWEKVITWPEGMDMSFVQQKILTARQLIALGSELFVEHELTVNSKLQPTDWWGADAMLRAKADALILPPGDAPAMLIDFKTGKKWDEDDFQLRVECLLVHLIYHKPVVQYSYWYVDTADTSSGTIDFDNGYEPVRDIMDTMRDMKQDIMSNNFPPKKNRFCKWCDFHCKPECGI